MTRLCERILVLLQTDLAGGNRDQGDRKVACQEAHLVPVDLFRVQLAPEQLAEILHGANARGQRGGQSVVGIDSLPCLQELLALS